MAMPTNKPTLSYNLAMPIYSLLKIDAAKAAPAAVGPKALASGDVGKETTKTKHFSFYLSNSIYHWNHF